MKRFIILSTILIWVALGIFTLYYINRPTGNLDKVSVDYTLTSPMLYAAYNENETAADQQYLGKVIEVSGTVRELVVEENGMVSITLAGDDMFGVSCKMNSDNGMAKNISKGDGVTVKGRCSGKLMDVVLINCSLSES